MYKLTVLEEKSWMFGGDTEFGFAFLDIKEYTRAFDKTEMWLNLKCQKEMRGKILISIHVQFPNEDSMFNQKHEQQILPQRPGEMDLSSPRVDDIPEFEEQEILDEELERFDEHDMEYQEQIDLQGLVSDDDQDLINSQIMS